MLTALIISVISGYLLGSINSSIIVSLISQSDDIRTKGSGNAGTANMFRIYGKVAALATGAGDLLKAIAAVLIARWVFAITGIHAGFDPGYVAGLFVIIGHMFPLYFRFRGGKGVMAAVGVIMMIDPMAFAILLFIAVIVFMIWRITSIVSLSCALSLPLTTLILALVRQEDPLFKTLITLAYAILVIWAHRSNIRRLFNGTEKRIIRE